MGTQPGVEAASRADQQQPHSAWESAAPVDSRAWREGETPQVFTDTREKQTVHSREPVFHEGSQAVKTVPRGAVWSLSLEDFKTHLVPALNVLV